MLVYTSDLHVFIHWLHVQAFCVANDMQLFVAVLLSSFGLGSSIVMDVPSHIEALAKASGRKREERKNKRSGRRLPDYRLASHVGLDWFQPASCAMATIIELLFKGGIF